LIRSLLYVPADNEKFVAKAHERGADAIILDLEDSVIEARKDNARAALAEAVPSAGRNHASVFVRINSGPRQLDDAVAAARAGAFGVMIAKAKNGVALESLAGTLRSIEHEIGRPATCFIAQLEDPAAVLDARSIAKHLRVVGLITGGEDLATATGAEPTPEVLRFPKLLVHYAAKAEQKLSLGLLRTVSDYNDLEGIRASAREARAHGFDGASCIHPAIVPILNEAFSPSAEDIAWAERVIAATHDQPAGAFSLDGKMVDAPVIARALLMLERAKEAKR
jgi:citrate lyase subunit beta / citryl-CoA lyase